MSLRERNISKRFEKAGAVLGLPSFFFSNQLDIILVWVSRTIYMSER